MKCNYCGAELKVDTRVVLTSIPPLFNAYCEYCGTRGYVKCSDYKASVYVDNMLENMKKCREEIKIILGEPE